VIGAPPPVVKMVLDADISPDHFEGVIAYRTGSAPLSPAAAAEFHRRYGIPVLLGYGATEFLESVTGWSPGLWEEFGAAKLGSVGRPYPRVRLRVVDPKTGAELPAGEEGILEVDSPRRAGNLPPGWLRTADRARIDEEGFLWVLGRADDVIVRGGFKVDLTLVEAALQEHPRVTEACVVGVPDERLGEVPAAMVVLDGGADATDVTADELVDWVRERLPRYAVPTVIRTADAIPQTSTLKPRRVEVRRLLQTS
jgi:long-chain acyl-CoA synthetase